MGPALVDAERAADIRGEVLPFGIEPDFQITVLAAQPHSEPLSEQADRPSR